MSIKTPTFSRIQEAIDTPFDNTSNGFVSTDVQAAIEEVDDRPIPNAQIACVRKDGDDSTGVVGDRKKPFLTINAALAAITDNAITKPYAIDVGAGVFTESQIQMKPYVFVNGQGDESTRLVASSATGIFIQGIENSQIARCLITGATGAGGIGINFSSTTTSDASPFYIRDCRLGANETLVRASASTVNNLIIVIGCRIGGPYPFTYGFYATTIGAGAGRIAILNSSTNGISTPDPQYIAYASGAGCEIVCNACQFRSSALSTGVGFRIDNGARLRISSVNLRNFTTAIDIPNTGAAPFLNANAILIQDCTNDINISHAGTTGSFHGVADKTNIVNLAPGVHLAHQDPTYGFVCNGVTDISGFRTQEVITATSASTLTLIHSDPMCQVFTGSTSGQIIKLPDATTLEIGHRFEVWNQSTVTVLIKDNSGVLLLISVPLQVATAVLKDNTTVAGIWMLSITQPFATTATWMGARYFAVDYDGGDDENVGFSDTSLADAGTKAIKTLERLRVILPTFGNGQIAVIGIKARAGGATYRNIANTADDILDLTSFVNYSQIIVRGTDTVATANTVAFSDDAADQVVCGAQIKSGTNAGGYNPTGAPTTSVISCQLNGGGAANLSAEPALLGYRVRFDYNTPTVALRNAVGMIWSNTASQITLGTNLPATPSTSDIFYIEEPAVAISRCFLFSNNPFNVVAGTFTTGGVHIAGIRFVSSASPVIQQRGAIALTNFSFIDIPNSTSFSAVSVAGALDFRIGPSYTNQSGATITTGAGLRSEGSVTAAGCQQVIMTHHVTNQARPQILQVYSFSIGSACVSDGGIIFQNCGSPPAITNLGGNLLGNGGSTTNRRFRSTGVNVGDAINITRTGVLVYGVDITNAGAAPMIFVKGVGLGVAINDVVGSSGNTGNGLDLTLCRDCSILIGSIAANTFTGGAGLDIVCSGNVFYLHADYVRTDLKDNFGNHIQGSGASILGSVVYATNDTNANVGQYMICRATASGVVRAAFATTNAGASGVVGVSQSAFTTTQSTMLCNGGGTWIQFDATPTVGNVAYLSNVTAGQARDTAPPLLSLHQKLRLGRILRVSGTLGFVCFFPEIVPVLTDGAV